MIKLIIILSLTEPLIHCNRFYAVIPKPSVNSFLGQKIGTSVRLYCFLGIIFQIHSALILSLFCVSFTIAHVMSSHTEDD
jgi:hypothetical protein